MINSIKILSSYSVDFCYEDKRVSQMKTLNIFYLVIYEYIRYTMTSFFYVFSIAFRTNVSALRKCTDTCRKKVFWLRVQPLVHRLLHLFVGPERLASHRLFEWSNDVKITWGEVWRVRRMLKTLEGHILDCCNS